VTTPSQRRRDPQSIGRGWELAVAVAGGALIAVVLAALAGLGIASELWGGGWVWPHGTETITWVIDGLLHGQPGRGLPPDQLRRVAGPTPTYACIAVAESALLTVAVVTGVLIARYRRPGDARSGMASRSEAEQALGLRQLRAGRAVIRPDRYRPGRRPPTTAGGGPMTTCQQAEPSPQTDPTDLLTDWSGSRRP
jgi:hypothetical protein